MTKKSFLFLQLVANKFKAKFVALSGSVQTLWHYFSCQLSLGFNLFFLPLLPFAATSSILSTLYLHISVSQHKSILDQDRIYINKTRVHLERVFISLWNQQNWEFPGGPVVSALHLHCQGPGSIPKRGTKKSHKQRCMTENKQTKKPTQTQKSKE